MITDGYTQCLDQALHMYHCLRRNGQTPVLARLSVEGCYSDLPLSKRRDLARLLRQQEERQPAKG